MSTDPRGASPAALSYFVAASHSTIVHGGDADRQPYGIQHARRVGATRTACGLPALNWRILWELPFPSASELTCDECLVAVREKARHASSS